MRLQSSLTQDLMVCIYNVPKAKRKKVAAACPPLLLLMALPHRLHDSPTLSGNAVPLSGNMAFV